MTQIDIIEKKKRGEELSHDEIRFLINGYVDGTVADYQMSAFTMAVCLRGMSDKETAELTLAMAESGDMLDLSAFGKLSVDKHSTGGVGDKTTLVVAPVVASLGAKVAKMSGRGLGHTGGTIDKLESIPGYTTALDEKAFIKTAKSCGVSVISSTMSLAPADKKLYALRDVTGTVDSIPLIASSIMSKKLASGAANIVLDVKTGTGAFMKTYDESKSLAQRMVAIGKACGRNMAAVITDMNTPLGFAIGNALEVREALEVLNGRGPSDLRQVCVALSAEMLSLVFGEASDYWAAKAEKSLDDGTALEAFRKWICAQGADDIIKIPEKLPTAKFSHEVRSRRDGYIASTDVAAIGRASLLLGAGRTKLGDNIDMAAGIILKAKRGDKTNSGELIATMYSDKDNAFESAEKTLLEAFEFSSIAPKELPLIYEIIR